MLSLSWHACFPSVSCKVQSFIDSDSTAGLRSVVKRQYQTEIYGACEQLVGLGSAMHGCNSRGPAAEAERGPCCGLVWQQQSRAELARGRRREAKALHSAVPLSVCWVCVLQHHILYSTSTWSVYSHLLLHRKLMFPSS